MTIETTPEAEANEANQELQAARREAILAFVTKRSNAGETPSISISGDDSLYALDQETGAPILIPASSVGGGGSGEDPEPEAFTVRVLCEADSPYISTFEAVFVGAEIVHPNEENTYIFTRPDVEADMIVAYFSNPAGVHLQQTLSTVPGESITIWLLPLAGLPLSEPLFFSNGGGIFMGSFNAGDLTNRTTAGGGATVKLTHVSDGAVAVWSLTGDLEPA